jgi:hypothetical protein
LLAGNNSRAFSDIKQNAFQGLLQFRFSKPVNFSALVCADFCDKVLTFDIQLFIFTFGKNYRKGYRNNEIIKAGFGLTQKTHKKIYSEPNLLQFRGFTGFFELRLLFLPA